MILLYTCLNNKTNSTGYFLNETTKIVFFRAVRLIVDYIQYNISHVQSAKTESNEQNRHKYKKTTISQYKTKQFLPKQNTKSVMSPLTTTCKINKQVSVIRSFNVTRFHRTLCLPFVSCVYVDNNAGSSLDDSIFGKKSSRRDVKKMIKKKENTHVP